MEVSTRFCLSIENVQADAVRDGRTRLGRRNYQTRTETEFPDQLTLLLLLLFLTFSVLVANPKKTTLHGGQSRSWSAEQGKENKIKNLAAYPPPPPTLLVRRK